MSCSGTDTSESENDEQITKLLAATDKAFLNDSLFKSGPSSLWQNAIPLPSPRNDDDEYNFVKVTPGFRQYVARNLDKRIEKSVEYTTEGRRKVQKKKRKTSGGVKLFRDSGDFLSIEEESVASRVCSHKPRTFPKRKHLDVDSTVDEREKVKSVAVSPEDILNQTGTKSWTYKHKLFKYKKSKDGTLVSIDS